MDNENLAARLSAARIKAGLSAEELCDKCGVSPDIYARWESGEDEPDTASARLVADALSISSDMLLFGLEDRMSVKTMFPKGAEDEGKQSRSDWRFTLGLVLVILGVVFFAMMLISVQTNGYYDTLQSLLLFSMKTASFYIFSAMIVGGVVLCIISGVSKIRKAAAENKKD